jgi:hypothetical protein
MIARFPTLKPGKAVPPKPVSDCVPWGTPYAAGQAFPVRPHLPAGTYTLYGTVSGRAAVTITTDSRDTLMTEITASYANYSDDGAHVIDGTQSAERDSDSPYSSITWTEDLRLTGRQTGIKLTGPGRFTLSAAVLENILEATGTMNTTIDGVTYTQPGNGDRPPARAAGAYRALRYGSGDGPLVTVAWTRPRRQRSGRGTACICPIATAGREDGGLPRRARLPC